jgi:hypothetical protein
LVGTDRLHGGCAQKLQLFLGVLLGHTLDVGGGDDGELDAVVDNRVQ